MENPAVLVAIFSAFLSAFLGFILWYIEHIIKKRDEQEKERDKDRQEFEILVLESINANTDLCIANNIALKNGKCNGESERAMERVYETKRNMKQFMFKKGVEKVL